MRDTSHQSARFQSRFLGYVQLQVGSKIFALPVQAAPLTRPDGTSRPGGFFTEESGSYGILVDSEASAKDVQEQIQKASLDAANHISKKFLN
jgi:hypothetical protein